MVSVEVAEDTCGTGKQSSWYLRKVTIKPNVEMNWREDTEGRVYILSISHQNLLIESI